eukprot:7041573-Pyramimonas_sp.AAC.1
MPEDAQQRPQSNSRPTHGDHVVHVLEGCQRGRPARGSGSDPQSRDPQGRTPRAMSPLGATRQISHESFHSGTVHDLFFPLRSA